MTNNQLTIDELRESFNRVHNGSNRLQREYDLLMESERLGIPLDSYRRLYELKGEYIDPYPKTFGKKGVVSLVQIGVILTITIALGRYVWEAPNREKLVHYEAWQIINSTKGQKSSGGRIDALQDLNKDKISLQALDASDASLFGINLQNAFLYNANLSHANLGFAEFSNANLVSANLTNADFSYANLSGAYLDDANLSGANLLFARLLGARLVRANLSGATLAESKLNDAIVSSADLSNANLSGANLENAYIGCYTYCTNFKGAVNITPKQIKQAKKWQDACYDPEFRKQLGLPPQNPKCFGDEPPK